MAKFTVFTGFLSFPHTFRSMVSFMKTLLSPDADYGFVGFAKQKDKNYAVLWEISR